jgi:seryl-tRNA synthetase
MSTKKVPASMKEFVAFLEEFSNSPPVPSPRLDLREAADRDRLSAIVSQAVDGALQSYIQEHQSKNLIAPLDTKIEDLEKTLDQRFDRFQKDIERLSQASPSISNALAKHEVSLDDIKSAIGTLQNETENIPNVISGKIVEQAYIAQQVGTKRVPIRP